MAIGPGERFPRFYGPAYVEWAMELTICYPIPLHIIVRVCRDFMARARRWGRPSCRDRGEAAAYDKGYEQGFARGRKQGEQDFVDRTLAELAQRRAAARLS